LPAGPIVTPRSHFAGGDVPTQIARIFLKKSSKA
jgi:hypothetical protein